MTSDELTQYLVNTYGMTRKWPTRLEVDSETFSNICKEKFDDTTLEKGLKVASIIVGPYKGIMFKGIELILKEPASSHVVDGISELPILKSELKALHSFLFKVGYISYEHDPLIIALSRKLDKFFTKNET